MMKVAEHWTNPNEEWTPLNVHERNADGNLRVAGAAGKEETVKYAALMHKDTREVYQANSTLDTLWKVAAASALIIPHTIVTAVGCSGIVQAGKSIWDNGVFKKESYLKTWESCPSMKEAQPYLTSELKKGLFLGTVFLFGTTPYAGLLFKTACVFSWFCYVAYNPRGAAMVINKAEKTLNIKPKAETQTLANDWTFVKDWKEVATGAIQLNSVFEFTEVGNIGDKINNEPRFPSVEEKKTQ